MHSLCTATDNLELLVRFGLTCSDDFVKYVINAMTRPGDN